MTTFKITQCPHQGSMPMGSVLTLDQVSALMQLDACDLQRRSDGGEPVECEGFVFSPATCVGFVVKPLCECQEMAR